VEEAAAELDALDQEGVIGWKIGEREGTADPEGVRGVGDGEVERPQRDGGGRSGDAGDAVKAEGGG
jgi:hypothetical protein